MSKKAGVIKLVLVLSILLVSVIPAQAGLLDPILDPIQNLFNELTNQIEDELESSRVGRELNRIVEDIEGVTEIIQEFENLATLVTSASPPLALANLAVQYGHDPDSVLPRFQERVSSLESNYGNGQQLSETEMAAALQSVLEEPPLPDGVYMGDNCIVDLSNCPQVNSGGHVYRGSYYAHSCYLDGVVSKKKSGGLNKAACGVNLIDAWSRMPIDIRFFSDTQYATYDWERCASVIFTEEDQNQFLASRGQVCDQPIGNYELGSVCVVDYTSCSNNTGSGYNANRIGTISYNTRDWYVCEVANRRYTLKIESRDACADVYVGDREVNEFLAANPEPVQQVQNTSREITENTAQILEQLSTTRDPTIRGLGDMPLNQEEQPRTFVYGKNGVVDITPPSIQEKKDAIEARLIALGALKEVNVQALKELIEGKQVPDQFKKYVGSERAEVSIRRDYGKDLLFCVVVNNGVVESFDVCSTDNSFKPTIKIQTSQSALENMKSADDVAAALEDGRISYKAVGLFKKAKFWIAVSFFKLFK